MLTENPARDVRGPDRGPKKSKTYLYPSEFLKFISCTSIPVRWRRLYTLTTYLYARAAEIRGLEWDDVDLEHGIVFIHRSVDDEGRTDTTKGEVPRRFLVEPELLPLLRCMRDEAEGVGRVFDPLPTEKHLAPMLRRELQRSGVTRKELFTNDKTRKWMTFHDLRSTGITWMAIRGDEPLKIRRRAGHKSFDTTLGYIREAEAIRDGFGTPFPPSRARSFGPTKGPRGVDATAMYTKSKDNSWSGRRDPPGPASSVPEKWLRRALARSSAAPRALTSIA